VRIPELIFAPKVAKITYRAQYAYDAYGTSTVLTPAFSTRVSSLYGWETLYSGYRLDSDSMLYYVRHRYYHRAVGAWTSRDPAGLMAGDANLYRYAFTDPILLVDPHGLFVDTSGLAGRTAVSLLAIKAGYSFAMAGGVLGMSLLMGGRASGPPPAGIQCKCGLEIGENLRKVLDKTRQFLDGDAKRAASICAIGRFDESVGWDIYELAWQKAKFEDRERGCGIEGCAQTASVDGVCYHTHAINYILWGFLGKYCGMPPGINEGFVELHRHLHKLRDPHDPFGLDERLVWSRMGYLGIYKWETMVSHTGPAGEAEAALWNKRNAESVLSDCGPCGADYKGTLTVRLLDAGKTFHKITYTP
jgi:RHS repeat-associated protein